MILDKRKFQSQLPPFFPSLLEEIFHHGFTPILVGGSVRDFFLKGSLGNDWDLELTHPTIAFNTGQWKDFGKGLSRFGKMTFLPYDIIRIEAGAFQLEFSPPRIEHFKTQEKGHSNFDAEFNFKLPFSEAVKRRDFTINAMGVKFNNSKDFEFLDPLEGLRHLSGKTLHHAGADFNKDPVRFLRALRFSLKLGFSFSPELKKVLEEMNLSGVTSSYVWSEMQKSGDAVSYLKMLSEWKTLHSELYLPVTEAFLPKVNDIKKMLFDPGVHESWIIALEWTNLSWDTWREFFSVGSESARRLARWASSSKDFQNIFPEEFHGEFEEVRDKKDFEKLFDWYFTTKQILQKHPNLPLLKMIEKYLPHWIHLFRFEPPKDVKHIDPPYRAKYQVWNLCQRL